VHGLNNVAEAVRQLRGDGTNQVHGAGVALCSGFGGSYGSAAILTAPLTSTRRAAFRNRSKATILGRMVIYRP
jgi:hypothetical protein